MWFSTKKHSIVDAARARYAANLKATIRRPSFGRFKFWLGLLKFVNGTGAISNLQST